MAKKSFKIRDNLAEALDDTVSSAKNNAGELHVEIIPLRKVVLDRDNPREFFLTPEDLYQQVTGTEAEKKRKLLEKDSLISMAKSIQEQGVLNPVIVYKQGESYQLIAGERRFLASIIAEKTDIPAKVLTSKPDQLKLSLLQWIENIEREDLSLWERLRNLEKIIASYADMKHKNLEDITGTDLSQLLGCSLQQGANYRSILHASNILKNHIQSGSIKNIEKAAFIAKQPEHSQEALIQSCVDGNTLAEMKKMLREKPPEKIKQAGRPTFKINFGSTTNTQVAKIILDSICKNKELSQLNTQLGEIGWDDPKSLSAAFKKLIKLLEEI